ncbi:carboxylesterase family protein [Zopfia rhizophila CBS 207.26]|uniref:Carboxylesterase family protein n=1 Tax=Zopfia rhizophila CBS 207.26 TaxID=1314779 RepID=A0A6A6EUY4_9PEZI|nr:carboxylesterase family protein [Zopfia rhizophila CBS 207.26]
MKGSQHFLLYSSLFATSLAYLNSHDLLAKTKQGQVRGFKVNDDVNAFLGIPFAEPPVGPLRWQPPQPAKQWGDEQAFNASKFGDSCYQFHYYYGILSSDANGSTNDPVLVQNNQSEDCLTLNVFVPRNRPAKNLPVFFWSYGGGFVEGSTALPVYNPTNFVEETKDIIVVTSNYRIGLWGFPNSPALPITGQNLGIRDVRLALEWVRENIASFGGNPDHIVMGGESAGAANTDVVTFAYPEDPIIKAAILSSGTVQIASIIGDDEADNEFVRVATSVGCADSDRKKELACMVQVDGLKLKHAVSNLTFNPFGAPSGGTPMVDNVTVFSIEEYINKTIAGDFAHIPTFIGIQDKEGDSLGAITPDGQVNRTASDETTNIMFNCPASLQASVRRGFNIPVWRYRFMGAFPSVTPLSDVGAYHGEDIFFLWNTINEIAPGLITAQPFEVEAAKYLQKAYADFIRDPESGLEKKRHWPKYNQNATTLIQFFPNQSANAVLGDPRPFDEVCLTLS